MDARTRLQLVLHRVRRSAAELRLQPETFDATFLLDLSAGDLADILRELFPEERTNRADVESIAVAER